MKFFLLVFLMILGSCSTLDSNHEENSNLADAEINLDVTKLKLDNGLTILLHEDRRLPIIAYYTFFDVGGRYEQKGLTGATHFLEHMMFKGTNKFAQGQFDGIIESNGGATNAYTTFDSTVYYQTFPSSLIEKIVELEADRMADILLDENSLEKERSVILEERKMRYENSPGGKLFLETLQALYKGTPYGLSVIGDNEDIKALTRDNLKKFHSDFYAPNNAILVIAGDFETSKVIQMIKDHYGKIPSNTSMASLKKEMDSEERFTFKIKSGKDIDLYGSNPNPMFMIAFKGMAQGSRPALVLDMLSSILGDGNSSYFSEKYVKNKRPMLSNVYASNYTLKNSGSFLIGGELLSKTSISTFRKTMKQDFAKLCSKSIDERNLQKTKNQYLKYYYDAIKTNDGIAKFLGSNESVYGDYAHYKKELEIYNSITVDEVVEACHKIFNQQSPIFVTIWNKNKIKK